MAELAACAMAHERACHVERSGAEAALDAGLAAADATACERLRLAAESARAKARDARRIRAEKESAAAWAASDSFRASSAAAKAERAVAMLKSALGHDWVRGSGIVYLGGQAILDRPRLVGRGPSADEQSGSSDRFTLQSTWANSHRPVTAAQLQALTRLLEHHYVEEVHMRVLTADLRRGELQDGVLDAILEREGELGSELVPASEWCKQSVIELIHERHWRLVLRSMGRWRR